MPDKSKVTKNKSPVARASRRPSGDVLHQLAGLAKIPGAAVEYFSSEVKEAIRCAHREQSVRRLRLHPAHKIASILKRSAQCAGELRDLLSDIDGVPITPKVIAGKYLRAALLHKDVHIKDAIAYLDHFAIAAERAVMLADVGQGRPRGTSYNASFDLFVERLFLAAQGASGKLTLYKSPQADRGWAGTLLQSLDLLRPWLPEKFPPPAGISGKSLDRIAQRYRGQQPQKVGGKS
ncbi:MAG: hypothetical protein ACRECV_18165 [Xanthobacteraceae bacterium]